MIAELGMVSGRSAAIADWHARREERAEDERVRAALREAGVRLRRPATKIDWSTQPLGREPDHVIAERLGVDRAVVCAARNRLGIAPLFPRLAWTRREDKVLREHYAQHGFAKGPAAAVGERLGRTVDAVCTRMASLRLSATRSPRRRWPATVNDLVLAWGYSRTRIVIAAERAGVTFARGRRNAYLVTREQADAIRTELAQHPDGARLHRARAGEWGKGGHAAACVACGRSNVARKSRDRCAACWRRATRESRS